MTVHRMVMIALGGALVVLPSMNQPAAAQTVTSGAQAAKKQVAATTAATKQQAAPAEGSDLDQRVGQLEEQIVDMQVTVGTLQSLARGGSAPPAQGDGSSAGFDSTAPVVGGGDIEGRVGGLEGQMQALSNQMADLRAQVEQLNLRLGGVAGQAPGSIPKPGAGEQGALVPNGGATGDLAQLPDDNGGFGDTTVDQGQGGNAAGAIALGGDGNGQGLPDTTGEAAQDGTAPAPGKTAAIDPAAGPDKVYEEAYGLLLQQDYPAAEAGFVGFLGQFPTNKLAGNAQYWLGETYYVRGNYKDAASAFLKGYNGYKKGQKAPDSLLKLAMSLSRLGQRDQACQAFDALDSEYPQAAAQVKRRAQSERQRAGC